MANRLHLFYMYIYIYTHISSLALSVSLSPALSWPRALLTCNNCKMVERESRLNDHCVAKALPNRAKRRRRAAWLFFAGIVRTLLGRFKSFALKKWFVFSCVLCAAPPIAKKRRSKKQKLLPHVIRKVHSSHVRLIFCSSRLTPSNRAGLPFS